MPRSSTWTTSRSHHQTVREAFGWNCIYCRRRLRRRGRRDSAVNPSLDHVVPRAGGGLDTAENIVLSCRRCNEQKASQSLVQWLLNEPKKGLKARSQHPAGALLRVMEFQELESSGSWPPKSRIEQEDIPLRPLQSLLEIPLAKDVLPEVDWSR